MEYYSERKQILSHDKAWMNLVNIILNEITQS